MSFSCNDKDTLISYVYGECDAATAMSVERHLAVCAGCADEVSGVGSVREALTAWKTPERLGGFKLVREDEPVEATPATVLRPARWWQSPLPALARVAAAILLFAGGAAVANLEVRYDKDGFMVRTGWHQTPGTSVAAKADQLPTSVADRAPSVAIVPSASQSADQGEPWRVELASLERQLRDEFHAQLAAARTSAPAPTQTTQVAAGFDENRFLQRVHTLLDESEHRQEVAMAYMRSEVQAQRRADMQRVQQTFTILEGPGLSPQLKRQTMDNLFPVSLKR